MQWRGHVILIICLQAIFLPLFGDERVPTIRIAGSDLLSEALDDPALFPNASISLSGSVNAVRDLEMREVSIAIVAMGPGITIPNGCECLPVASFVSALIVNAGNPIESASLQDLRRIFAQGNRAGHENITWSDLGVDDPDWIRRPITPMGFRREGDLSLEIFRAHVIGAGNFRNTMQTFGSADEVIDAVVADASAIGIIPYTIWDSRVRSIPIAVDNADGAATNHDLHSPSYPLRIPICLAFWTDARESVRHVVESILSDGVSVSLEQSGVLPVSAAERRDTIRSLYGPGIDGS